MVASVNPGIRAAQFFIDGAQKVLQEPTVLPGPLFHYADINALCSIVPRQALWASNVRCMNDTRELEHGLQLLAEASVSHAHTSDERALYNKVMSHPNFISAAAFAVSFSTNGDLLSQWRAYADDGNGYAIGFDQTELEQLTPVEWTGGGQPILMRVEYNENEQKRLAKELVALAYEAVRQVMARVDTSTAAFLSMGFASLMVPFASMCKSDAFLEESSGVSSSASRRHIWPIQPRRRLPFRRAAFVPGATA